jgi:Fe-S cluster biosynthesis and repair protein YggX
VLLQRKLQQQKQEIDAWKRSLAYQAQLLNQRKLEIEEYLEELCHQDIEDLLFDLRQIHFQSFQVEELSQQMIFFAEELQRRSPLYA